jgi:hypothetical protein
VKTGPVASLTSTSWPRAAADLNRPGAFHTGPSVPSRCT